MNTDEGLTGIGSCYTSRALVEASLQLLHPMLIGETGLEAEPGVKVISMPHADRIIAPIVYTVPLQLLAYHAAVLKGTDIDQPRNLAKSVTVE